MFFNDIHAPSRVLGLEAFGVGSAIKEGERDALTQPRTLQTYAVVYVTEGEGWFSSRVTGEERITAGDAFFLFPGKEHTYGPDDEGRWKEYWYLFGGFIAEAYQTKGYITPSRPTHHVGVHAALALMWENAIAVGSDLSKRDVQRNTLFALLGAMLTAGSGASGVPDAWEARIARIADEMSRTAHLPRFDIRHYAEEEGVSYSYLRKRFKRHTGYSPDAYFAFLKTQRARDMLLHTSANVKEIADALGFDDAFYFSRWFKQREEMSPTRYRETYRAFTT